MHESPQPDPVAPYHPGSSAVAQKTVGSRTIDSLDNRLHEIIRVSNIPGLGVSIVGTEGILYARGIGLSDVANETPYRITTVQPIASISKTIIGIALLQLVEAKKLDLREDINTYLPFSVRNPKHPTIPITLLQLATHSSSISDTYRAECAGYLLLDKTTATNDFPKSFKKDYRQYLSSRAMGYGEYLESFLSPEGTEFDKRIFLEQKPGEKYTYSNIGATLAAYIIERVADQLESETDGKTYGIFWQVNQTGTNIGHTGSNYGITCRLIFNPNWQKAIFLMMNMSIFDDDNLAMDEIRVLQALSELAKALE